MLREARRMNSNYVGNTFAIRLVQETDCVAVRIIAEEGIDQENF